MKNKAYFLGKTPNRSKGFTLLELAIVIVVIGLIVGGILVGRDLIEATQLRKVVSDVERFRTTVNAFRLKYNCLPGDCLTASQFFTGCASGVAANCNGNGDGKITWWSGDVLKAEALRAWEHLGLAGMISGQFTGVYPGNGFHIEWVHVPPAPISQGIYGMYQFQIENIIGVGAPIDGGYMYGALFTPLQAYNIDSKYDDGNAVFGKIGGANGYLNDAPTYTLRVCVNVQQYDLTRTVRSCWMSFNLE